MWANIGLYFKYILMHSPVISFNCKRTPSTVKALTVPNRATYYLLLHLRLSSLFYSTQLVDIFAYESIQRIPKPSQYNDVVTLFGPGILWPPGSSHYPSVEHWSNTVVYNLYSLKTNERFFMFTPLIVDEDVNAPTVKGFYSCENLFLSANWLEREVSELSGVFFTSKRDTRNLLLTYGDSTTPFKKSYPCAGSFELNYDLNTDAVINIPVSLQF